MSDLDKIIAKVRAPIQSGRMSKREMARRAGIAWSALNDMEQDGWNPTRKTLDALLRAVKPRPLGNGANQRSVAA